jgi:hypothetical protein
MHGPLNVKISNNIAAFSFSLCVGVIQCVPHATEPSISLMSCQQQFLEKFGG